MPKKVTALPIPLLTATVTVTSTVTLHIEFRIFRILNLNLTFFSFDNLVCMIFLCFKIHLNPFVTELFSNILTVNSLLIVITFGSKVAKFIHFSNFE